MPCGQYHLRHLSIASSGVAPFALVHAWAAASPTQRSLAPWSSVPSALPVDEWVRESVVAWRKITERFAAYLKDYEASAAECRDARHIWVPYVAGGTVALERPPVAGDASRVLMERMEGPYRARKVLSDYRVVLEEMDGSATVPRVGGDAGVATSRLLKVPCGSWGPVRLEGAPEPVENHGLAEQDRRRRAQLSPGDLARCRDGAT